MNSTDNTIKFAQKALNMLERVARESDGFSLHWVSQELELHKSTTHRILQSLQGLGYLVVGTVSLSVHSLRASLDQLKRKTFLVKSCGRCMSRKIDSPPCTFSRSD
ncbi:MAG: helix-turn-helix domain-containing protein [Candidatus Bipolaricaulota bacterium]